VGLCRTGRQALHDIRHALTFEETSPMRAKRLTVQQRKEIFHSLVTTQDRGEMTVPQSVQHVSKQFEITEAQLRQIQDEGIEKEWPPLDEAIQPVN
jgi:hypothetical protein